MQIKFSKELTGKGAIVLTLDSSLEVPESSELSEEGASTVKKAIKASEFSGKKGKILSVTAPADEKYDTIVLYGIGKQKDKWKLFDIRGIGGDLYAELNSKRISEADVVAGNFVSDEFDEHEIVSNIAYGMLLRSYSFDKYFTKRDDEKKPVFKKANFISSNPDKAKEAFRPLEKLSDGVSFARDLVSEPSNVLYPGSYANICKSLKKLGVKVEILDEKDMKKLGMGSLLGVGQGSARESRLVVMQWSGADKPGAGQPIAFVGKGVTFDTGGISIKPSLNMGDMKYDMAGSAAVVGVMKALAGRKARVNAVGVIGLAENMPDGNAQRAGDIVKSMSGQTIEVLNTDAEGRLVLADALWYTQDRFKPQFMVDLATLTGAIVISLADIYGGIFSNNDDLAKRLSESGEEVGERVWRFPLGEEYNKMLESKIADMQNISDGRGAGSITAAQFLQRFVNDVPWAHIDIAGMAWNKKAGKLTPEGATGFGVQLLDNMVKKYYEV